MSAPSGPASAHELEAFLASPHVRGIEYIAPADVRAALERFLACCGALGREPVSLRGHELREILERRLSARYARGERLGQRTIDVLRVYLAFLEERLDPERARELRIALEESAEPFRAIVRGERAHPEAPPTREPAG